MEANDLLEMKNILQKNSQSTESCTLWTGKLASGYGTFQFLKKSWAAHRASFFVSYGHLPKDLYICHRCNNKRCINPNHLYAGTPKENTQDLINSPDYYKISEKSKVTKEENKKKREQNVKNGNLEFYTIIEFSNLLQVHPNTVRRALKTGRISGFKVGAGKRSSYRIPKSEINRIALFDMEEIIEKIIEKRTLPDL